LFLLSILITTMGRTSRSIAQVAQDFQGSRNTLL